MQYDDRYYSVPHTLVQQQREVEICATATTVEILHDSRRVAFARFATVIPVLPRRCWISLAFKSRDGRRRRVASSPISTNSGHDARRGRHDGAGRYGHRRTAPAECAWRLLRPALYRFDLRNRLVVVLFGVGGERFNRLLHRDPAYVARSTPSRIVMFTACNQGNWIEHFVIEICPSYDRRAATILRIERFGWSPTRSPSHET